jgi:hypothetical protein
MSPERDVANKEVGCKKGWIGWIKLDKLDFR